MPIMLGIAACAAVTLLATLLLRRLRPNWPRRRVSSIAAAIVPGGVMAVMLYIFVDVMLTPADQCGVDACAMAITGVIFIAILAFGAFAVCMALAEALQSVLERR